MMVKKTFALLLIRKAWLGCGKRYGEAQRNGGRAGWERPVEEELKRRGGGKGRQQFQRGIALLSRWEEFSLESSLLQLYLAYFSYLETTQKWAQENPYCILNTLGKCKAPTPNVGPKLLASFLGATLTASSFPLVRGYMGISAKVDCLSPPWHQPKSAECLPLSIFIFSKKDYPNF